VTRSDETPTVPLESLPAAALVAADGQVTAANAAARDLLGDDLQGTPLARLFPAGLPDPVTDAAERPAGPEAASTGDDTASFQRVRATPVDGDPVEVAVALGDTPGHESLLLAVPVDRLSGHSDDLQQFVSGVSHDLQQPLGVIRGYLELLRPAVEDELDEEALDHLQGAHGAVDRAETLLEDLLTYARVGLDETERPEREAVDLNDVLDEVVDALPARWDEPASVDVGSLPTIRGQRPRLARLFENLVSNALKYQDDPPRRVRVSAEQAGADGDSVRITVADNGVGIDPDEVDTLFDLFERGSAGREVDGSGVGLALCQGIVDDLGGRIEVETEPGEGSSFHVIVPPGVVAEPARVAESSPEAATESELASGSDADSGPRSVILVDDVEGLRSLVRTVLEKTGRYEVVGEAGTGEEGIEVAAETRPDVVLLDLSMPRMDGLEALPEIRDVAPDADVVIYSGFQKGRMVEKAQERGAVGYIEKGANPGEIIEQLEAALADGGSSNESDAPESAGSVS
jgi:signal transduction histidine kinase/ActR/RegA family two-component response regulator